MNYQLNYDLIFSEYYFGRLVGGIQTTVILFVLVLSLGLVLAVILVALRSAPFRPLRLLVAAFIEYQRNVPLLVHLLVWYFGIAAVLPKSATDFANQHGGEFFYGAVTLTLYGGAFISEELRGGLRAIPRAQYETARSLGLSGLQTLRLVIISQAIRNALPAVISQALSLYKNTSVTAAIGVAEIMYRTREVSTETFRVFEAFSIATLVYFVGSMIVLAAGALLTRHLHIPGHQRQ